MKNKIIIFMLLSSMQGALIDAMQSEPLVVLDSELISLEDNEVYTSFVQGEPIYRQLGDRELAAILAMPDNVKFPVVRGIREQCSTVENGIGRKAIIYKNYWVNNKLSKLESKNLDQYQNYSDYISRYMEKTQ